MDILHGAKEAASPLSPPPQYSGHTSGGQDWQRRALLEVARASGGPSQRRTERCAEPGVSLREITSGL
jgi:hypothetical protein